MFYPQNTSLNSGQGHQYYTTIIQKDLSFILKTGAHEYLKKVEVMQSRLHFKCFINVYFLFSQLYLFYLCTYNFNVPGIMKRVGSNKEDITKKKQEDDIIVSPFS